MRKRYRRKKGISNYVIIGICFLFLFVVGTIYASVSETLFLTGTVRIKNNGSDNSVKVTIKNDEYSQEGSTRIRYYYTYTITNGTNQTISSWKVLVSNMPTSAIEIAEWTHLIDKNDIENGNIIFKNQSYNMNIEPGQSLSIRFSFVASELINVNQLKATMYYGTVIPDEPDEPENTDKLTSLSVEPEKSTIKVGETLNLQVTKNPTNATETLSWTSSNTQIATVSQDGVVTAITEGSCVITVASGSISASCDITVNKDEEPPIEVESIDVDFSVTASWANSIQFKITIKNNSANNIQGCSFKIGVPDESSYTLWSGNCSSSGNTIICSNPISTNGSFEIYGQIDLPTGYEAKDYLTPKISEIQLQ